MASTYLSKTLPDAHGGGVYKWTYSFWVKRGTLGANQCMAAARNSGDYSSQIRFTSNDSLEIHDYRTSYKLQKITTRKFRDTSAWYHIVMSNDNSVSSPDLKIYVNGVEETSFSTDNEYSQNESTSFNNSYPNYIGQKGSGADYFDGSMSHFHFIDGTAYDASAFGSTDSTTGEWKIKTDVSVTYGTNGFFILKDGNSVTDQSGNSNNFTVAGGALTKTEDNPSNNFATMNPLHYESRNTSFNDGNTTLVSTGSASWTTHYGFSTLAMGSGKYYVEVKVENTGTSSQSYPIGIIDAEQNITSSLQDNGIGSIRASNGNITGGGSNLQTGLTAISAGDILAIAYDGDNGTLQFYRNGSTHGNAVTGIDTTKEYYVACDTYEGSSQFKFNFGNGTFGSSGISDAGTNASNNGIFEYDVPSGYTALSTKGLNL